MNNKSVSNIIYQGTYEKSKSNKKLKAVFDTCDITPYEMERPYGRIVEKKHNYLLNQLSHDREAEHQVITSLLENTIPTYHCLFPELISYCVNQESTEQAISTFIHNACIIGNCDYFTISQNSDRTKITYLTSSSETAHPINALGNIALLSDIIHLHSPKAPLAVSLTAKNLIKKRNFDEKFETSCVLDQNENSIIINNNDLEKSQNSFNRTLHTLQKEQINNIKRNLFSAGKLSSSVAEIIFNAIYSKRISEQNDILKILCNALQVSRWTLNRRLNSENTNFSLLLSEVKLQVSIKLLTEERLTIQEVSDWLAFSSHSAFSRFFKAKTGRSPRIYREAIDVEHR
ncbi:helix-turn-helix domain-containing protein [Saccharospirillum alexandrii]|uniref:helix-turn-helix domain-containing protein n=1 Tax=Saccharospirillum alexandrii TaxID=2448477 RepID=UPI000FDAFBA0|nr:helix-turn-helix domain-containing protein [Saccharospirillum alexandrii]